jgi:hypothetical protein
MDIASGDSGGSSARAGAAWNDADAGIPGANTASVTDARVALTALTTFEFKHGVIKTPVEAASMAEVERVLRTALRLKADAFNIEFVNVEGQLQPLSQVSLSALGAFARFRAGPWPSTVGAVLERDEAADPGSVCESWYSGEQLK